MDQQSANATQPKLEEYSLSNDKGMTMRVTNFGGRIISLSVPDRAGKFADVVLGYDSATAYLKDPSYFGALIGRVGNRIAKGTFAIGNRQYQVPVNNGVNSLHGGPIGFHNVYWNARQLSPDSLELKYTSANGDAGYPGRLDVKVIYSLTTDNALVIDYQATTDSVTVVNLTHHSYFNLAGHNHGTVLDQKITIVADRFTPVDEGLIPTGELKEVKGTPFDFRSPRNIGERINDKDEQLKFGKGYDHNWVLNKKPDEFGLAARVEDPSSGRVLEVWTTEPGLQFYSGNFLDGTKGKQGAVYPFRGALCLETQHFPDSPNHPNFPSILLKPGEQYTQHTAYKFSVAQ